MILNPCSGCGSSEVSRIEDEPGRWECQCRKCGHSWGIRESTIGPIITEQYLAKPMADTPHVVER